MRALYNLVLPVLVLLAGVAASVLGFWVGGIVSLRARLLALVGACLLVLPVNTIFFVLFDNPYGQQAFAWWFVGLTWLAAPWCIAVGLGYLFGSLRRRAKG